MTAQGPLRELLLNDYIKATQGKAINSGPLDISPIPLAQDYLQFLLQRRLAPIHGHPKDWAGKGVGRQLANLPGSHDITSPHDAPARREPWATFYPSPFTNPNRRHREDIWPEPGDLLVFDGSSYVHPFGTLGVFVSRPNHPTWYVYTQGPRPPAVIPIDTNAMIPLGWWRVTDHRLRLRSTGQQPVAPQGGAR